MPLTAKGRKIRHAFMVEYGKKRGTSIFYAFENKHHGLGLIRKKRR